MSTKESAIDLALALLGEAYGSVALEAEPGAVRVQAGGDGPVFEGATVEQALVAAADKLLRPDLTARVRAAATGRY